MLERLYVKAIVLLDNKRFICMTKYNLDTNKHRRAPLGELLLLG